MLKGLSADWGWIDKNEHTSTLADVWIPTKCEVTLGLIMKDGKIYKNTILGETK